MRRDVNVPIIFPARDDEIWELESGCFLSPVESESGTLIIVLLVWIIVGA